MHEILINRLVKLAQGNKSWLIGRLDVTAVDRDLKTINQTHTYGPTHENLLLITYECTFYTCRVTPSVVLWPVAPFGVLWRVTPSIVL